MAEDVFGCQQGIRGGCNRGQNNQPNQRANTMLSKEQANVAAEAILTEAQSRRSEKLARTPWMYRERELLALDPQQRRTIIEQAKRNVRRKPLVVFVFVFVVCALLGLALWIWRHKVPDQGLLLLFLGLSLPLISVFLAILIRREAVRLSKSVHRE